MDMELRTLQQVIALANEGSFAKAARVLHISQPALSRSIKEAEARIGFALFDRGRHGAELTDAGKTVLRHALNVMMAADDMRREVSLMTGLSSGELLVGCGVYPSELFMGAAIGSLLKPGSKASIRIVNDGAGQIIQRLRRREIDLGITDPRGHGVTAEFTILPLATFTGYLVVRKGHPVLANKRITLDRLLEYPLCTTSLAHVLINQLNTRKNSREQQEQELFARWIPTVHVDSVAMMKQSVCSSDAVTIMPYLLIEKELEQKILVVLPIALNWLQATFSAMHLSHRTMTPLGAALIAAAQAASRSAVDREGMLKRKWGAPR